MIKKLSILILPALFISASMAYSMEQKPAQKAEKFLQMIQNGKIDQAYDMLLLGSSIPSSKPQAVQMLKTQTSSGLPLYGSILGFEKIREENFGTSVIRLVYIIKSELAPTAWEFYFYKPKGSWFLANIRFNDQFQFLESRR